MANLPTKGWMTQDSILPDVRNPLGLHLNHNDLKLGKNWLSSAQFTKGRLRDSSEYHERSQKFVRDLFEQKYLKSGKKRLSYGQFTNGRLRDSSECHAGCRGSFGAIG